MLGLAVGRCRGPDCAQMVPASAHACAREAGQGAWCDGGWSGVGVSGGVSRAHARLDSRNRPVLC